MLIKIGDALVSPEEIAAMREEIDSVDKMHYIVIRFKNAGDDFLIEGTMDEAEAVLIDAGYIENPYPEEELETPTLSEAERDELDALDAQGYEYIARDIDGKLYAYKSEPGREGGYYYAHGTTAPEKVVGDFLCVDADEAWSISFLLCE